MRYTIISETAGATLKCKSRIRYNLMHKQQVLHCNAGEAGATL
jgi:hypothetical protein